MLPAALTSQLEHGIADFLRASFWSSTPGMEDVIARLIETPGGILKGPYVSLDLPFERGGETEFFPQVPLGFPAHLHQEQAFKRLSGDSPKSSLVATGTGSGKTEAFLWPILDYCRRHTGTAGIKAILVYPMNALATDQAERVAKAIHGNRLLNGGVRAGLFVGESPGEKRESKKNMGPDHIITDRKKLLLTPPDILLTNYKMLDYLLVRPHYQRLWQDNLGGPLRFLVVDELHTFDGAQGTDLACLIRRLKARLEVEVGTLCCIGTSATLGGSEAPEALRDYAQDIFGEPFDAGAVITERRQSQSTFFAGHLIEFTGAAGLDDPEALDPASHVTPGEFVRAQQALWFDEPIEGPLGSDAWRVKLGEQLLRHSMLVNLVRLLDGGPRSVDDLLTDLARGDQRLRNEPELARRVVLSFLALISEARTFEREHEQQRLAREAAGEPPQVRPFLNVRLQLWQREMARMVASVEPEPCLRYSDDLQEEQQMRHLPLIHCRDCGAMGWATLQTRDRPEVFRTGLQRFYRAFFDFDPQVKFLWPDTAAPKQGKWEAAPRFALWRENLVRPHVEIGDEDEDDVMRVVVSDNLELVRGSQKLHRNCPFCASRGSLTLLGFRAATLTSVYIDQFFASTYNDDKKLLAFSDSVQDAAHRAGFFGARTWRFNLRVALQRVVREHEGVTLEALPDTFCERWRGASEGDVDYVSTFLAPNMEWFPSYEQMQAKGEVPPGGALVRDVDRRVAFEIFTEYSLQSRIGRSLSRTGCSTVYLDSDVLDQVLPGLLESLRNEIGGLRELDAPRLRSFLVGALTHLRERGGLNHRELPEDFLQRDGDIYKFYLMGHLPSYGRASRIPALLTNDPRSARFDSVLLRSKDSWYERWVDRCMGDLATLIGSPVDIWNVVLPALTDVGLLVRTDGKRGSVWGLRPGALRVTSKVERLCCSTCKHWVVIGQAEFELWSTIPCLTARCGGQYQRDVDSSSYFARLYNQGEVERVFSAEHTGLLGRSEREEVERHFKAEPEERRPWYPNLLSCTPTLEMGIDIGALSSAILCSVPPTQANYLQRIGRAGRRDGNSLLLTIAQAKLHDLYFYARPEEMIAGEVSPPGVFLNASAVLERQLSAYCLDRWNADGGDDSSIPKRLRKVFEQLDDGNIGRFPANWVTFINGRQEQLLAEFIALFPDRFSEATQDHLRAFLIGGRDDEGSLSYKLLELFQQERKQRDSLREQSKKLKRIIDQLNKAKAKDKDHDDKVLVHQRERGALSGLVNAIDNTGVLEFLTDQGLLPNYAFPESPIRLRSVIWRKKQHVSEGDKSRYETLTFEYTRPAMSAISELAPENRFFAGGRKVTIDQVDVATAKAEWWRFCDNCTCSRNLAEGDLLKNCPNCESPVWGEDSQKRQLLRLEQVFAKTRDRDSRIRDDQDERQPRHYNKRMLMAFDNKDLGVAWTIKEDAVPFGFEYIRRASFREINFGEFSDNGSKFRIDGREEVRQGFLICRHCGKVQKRNPQGSLLAPPDPEHTLWCGARKKGTEPADFETALYLYREFHSEALRLLLPLSDIGSDRQLNSFLAAFQLGLRDRYGGRVDHLHTHVYSEPDPHSDLRRQYLVLYDTVPGGTGYLKDFTRKSAEDTRHPIFEILTRALKRMTTCVCYADTEKDGCYRCLFAYRSSRDMANTSRQVAIEIFERIAGLEGQLSKVDCLSSVTVSGMMDSVLEARFIEALRRLGTDARPVQVSKSMVRDKPGFKARIGDQLWNIEEQHNVGPKQGINPFVSVDFVFHPGSNQDGRLPIAVFLDGYQHHKDRIGKDMLQRMTLLASERYDVWSFTWFDVEQVFKTDVEESAFLLHPVAKELQAKASRDPGVGHFALNYTRPMVELFMDLLAGEDRTIPWERLATTALITQMKRPGQVRPGPWVEELAERVPAEVARWFEDLDSDGVYLHRPPTAEMQFGLWAYAPMSAARDPSRFSEYKVLAWLNDSDQEQVAGPEFRKLWRGYLHAFQMLRALPSAWFLTCHGQQELDFRTLALVRDGPQASTTGAWAKLDIEDEFRPLAERLAQVEALELPEPGLDLLDERGHTSGLIGELVWKNARVAVVESLDDADSPVDPAWTLFAHESLQADISPLLASLGHKGN